MIRSVRIVACMITYLVTVMPCSGHGHFTGDVQSYILSKLDGHDIVLMGTTHRQPAILELAARLLPLFSNVGVTHLALEIASDQQANLDRFLDTGAGLASIRIPSAIDCPAYRRLLEALQRLGPGQRPRVIAIDLPRASYAGKISRDEHMASVLAKTLQNHPRAKILAMLGSLHVLRQLRWANRILAGHPAIRTCLSRWRPDLRVFSMVHIIPSVSRDCDFSRRLGPLQGMVAMDIDACFNGWRLGITACLALQPSHPWELVDGVIVH
jgi:uncharacterized iron-regulated protein